jgi:hypothetical protein
MTSIDIRKSTESDRNRKFYAEVPVAVARSHAAAAAAAALCAAARAEMTAADTKKPECLDSA